MSLAWRERATLYLGSGLVLFKEPGLAEVTLSHPTTWPIDRVLGELQAARSRKVSHRRFPQRGLDVHLSGAHSPAVWCDWPAQVRRWKDQEAIRLHQVSRVMQLELQDLKVVGDAAGHVCSGVAKALLTKLEAWASEAQMSLQTVSPLWAVATRCALVKSWNGHGVMVYEPGVMTSIENESAQTIVDAESVESEGFSTSARRLVFSSVQQPVLAAGPAVWAGHWAMS